jgi:hypothetical protein
MAVRLGKIIPREIHFRSIARGQNDNRVAKENGSFANQSLRRARNRFTQGQIGRFKVETQDTDMQHPITLLLVKKKLQESIRNHPPISRFVLTCYIEEKRGVNMVGETPPAGSGSDGSHGIHLPTKLPDYTPQFQIDVSQWRKYWQTLFGNTQLSDKEIHQMTDQFVKFVWDQMNTILQHAIQTQKKLDQKQKEDEGG